MGTEPRAFLGDRPPRRETEHLIPAAVCQDRFRPADKPMEAAAARDEIVARPEIEMVGVAQEYRGAGGVQILMRDAFHRALRPDRHERGRLDLAVGRRQDTAARASVGVRHTKRKR